MASTSEVKAEVEPIDLEAKIIELLTEHADGLTSEQLTLKTQNIEDTQRMAVINRLLSSGRVEMRKTGPTAGDILLKLRNQENLEKIKGASPEETLIYHTVEDAGNKGIWVRDIRSICGLPQSQINKIIKTLEQKRLIKNHKVPDSKKKVYMLYEFEPDSSVTGGVFYSNEGFDDEFVSALSQQCLKILKARQELAVSNHAKELQLQRRMSLMSSTDIWTHINELKVFNVKLSVENVEKILDTLVFDGEADKSMSSVGNLMGASYRVVKQPSVLSSAQPAGTTAQTTSLLTSVPCTFCPVFDDCRRGMAVSPQTCPYFKEWPAQL